MASKSRQTDAVIALKAPSQDPQSESIAVFVSVEVVNGPGVSKIGPVMRQCTLGSIAIALKCISQRSFQRSEPWLEVLPLVESLAEYGLPNLFRAGGAYAALGFVKIQAGGLELEAAKIEEPADICVEILDDVLVIYLENPSRQHGVPMIHQRKVGSIVARDVLDAVGKLLTGGKQLLEIAEAAGHGLAARVDDPGVRQHQMNQADVPEVVRHLVDEEGLIGAVDARFAQVLLTQAQKLLGTQVPQHSRIARIRGAGFFTALQFVHDSLDVRKLVRAFDACMRGH